MPIVPFRGLGASGILTDPSPYQLNLNAWSAGYNVQFRNGKVISGPVFKAAYALAAWTGAGGHLFKTPTFIAARRSDTGVNYDDIIAVDNWGFTWFYQDGSFNDRTASAAAGPYAGYPSWTASQQNNVIYLNHPEVGPSYWSDAAGVRCQALPAWSYAPPVWTCRSMRAYGDYVVAINVTKGAVNVSTMVKTSDLCLAGQPPASWDQNDPTTSATENVLDQCQTPLIDGCVLKQTMVLYSQDSIWAMDQDGSALIFQYDELFSDGGLIAPNCVVEVDGVHYCFGPNDIYHHDGTTKASIVVGKWRDFIFENLWRSQAESCFVHYMPRYRQVLFAWPSNATVGGKTSLPYFSSPAAVGCTIGFLYDIDGGTGSFIDLPNVVGACAATIDQYFNNGATGSFSPTSTTDTALQSFFLSAISTDVGGRHAIVATRVLCYDYYNRSPETSMPYAPECNAPPWVERIGLALDQEGADLQTYKTIRRLFPQATTFTDPQSGSVGYNAIMYLSSPPPAVPLNVTVGASMVPQSAATYGPTQTFDPATQYHVDCMVGGRYLAVKFGTTGPGDWELAGYDADVVPQGAY